LRILGLVLFHLRTVFRVVKIDESCCCSGPVSLTTDRRGTRERLYSSHPEKVEFFLGRTEVVDGSRGLEYQKRRKEIQEFIAVPRTRAVHG
jgi:hypothetical protein